jgi:hydrogenase maturation protein HypF
MIEALDIQVKGIVQGVGFRPFVYREAKAHNLNGWVLNATDGVFIHAEGTSENLDHFALTLSENPPAAAQVKEVDLHPAELEHFTSFEIRYSDASSSQETTLVSPDLATCKDCVHELFDPSDRRYRYPFINCTNCGPRFTIIQSLPYDRPATSMGTFTQCPTCLAEYRDPGNRRFHAQPNACFECGPHISWYEPCASDDAEHSTEAHATSTDKVQQSALNDDLRQSAPTDPATDTRVKWGRTRTESDAILARAVAMLHQGRILAVKGLGGFHLVCDADNPDALAALRTRKHRAGKAFAVMVADVDVARSRCFVSDDEAELLQSPARPIVLLRKRPDAEFAQGLADRLPELGVMLPATPLQHLLIHDYRGMLVMTSGNVHDDPIQIDDASAYQALCGIADAFIGNDRPILARYDDSVVRLLSDGDRSLFQSIRRARGYAPLPLALPGQSDASNKDSKSPAAKDESCPECDDAASSNDAHSNKDDESDCSSKHDNQCIFATGPEQKDTFCYTRAHDAFVSQHIGDMEHASTMDSWHEARTIYRRLFDLHPTRIACDRHPEYLTSKWAHAQDIPCTEVQHHHAHIAAVMAENNLQGPVCGIAFDGTGYGMDGALWGGEVMLCNLASFERFANFTYVPLPGGAAAIRHPRRCAYGVLWAYDLLDHPAAADMIASMGDTADVCNQMIDRGLNCPQTSSVGRLFDAASALLGLCVEPSYEGEGAILLEAALPDQDQPDDVDARYHIDIVKNTATKESTALDTSVVLFDAAPLFKALLDDKGAGVSSGIIARHFHQAFVDLIVRIAQIVEAVYGIRDVVLGGGVFMNRYLVEHALVALRNVGYNVALNRDLPPNDACISYGQAIIALNQPADATPQN